jgi:hypothetical protein
VAFPVNRKFPFPKACALIAKMRVGLSLIVAQYLYYASSPTRTRGSQNIRRYR